MQEKRSLRTRKIGSRRLEDDADAKYTKTRQDHREDKERLVKGDDEKGGEEVTGAAEDGEKIEKSTTERKKTDLEAEEGAENTDRGEPGGYMVIRAR